MEQYRIESDLLGKVQLPVEAPYGAQTQRSLANFPLSGEKRFADYPDLLLAMLSIKKACALANHRAGLLDEQSYNAIDFTIENLIKKLPPEYFPVHSFHGGGGISFNMNVNEVVANLANKEFFQSPFGSYTPLHPNDHINRNQSTNDVFCSACHLALIKRWQQVEGELQQLEDSFNSLANRYQSLRKISRTCFQDAVDISFKDFFSGYSALLARGTSRVTRAVEKLYAVNLGGTIVGRPEDVDSRYFASIIPALQETTEDTRIRRAENLFDSAQNLDDMTGVGCQLKLLAQGLIKIGKDLRLLCSGPMTGLGEIHLPAVQPGSSAMPGKINPAIPEFLIQSCFMIVGRCHSAEMAMEHGELDLNVWEATVIVNLLDSMAALENGVKVLRTLCVEGITVNEEKNTRNVDSLIPLLTRLKIAKGYAFATKEYRETDGNLEALRSLLADEKSD